MAVEGEQKSIKNVIYKALLHYKNANVAVKASIWFTICSIIQKGISVITMPIFTRLMSTEQYGQYNVFLTWYNILVLLVTLNVHTEIFNKGLIEHSEEKDAFTASQAGLLIALTGFWIALYLPFHKFINNLLGLSTVLVLFMVFEILGTAIVGLWSARKRFEFDYPKIVKLTLSMSVLNPIVGIIAVLITEHKAEAKIIANAIIPIIISVVILVIFSQKGNLFKNRQWWKPVVIACLPLVPHYLSLVLLNQSDKLMINHFSGPADAAIYSVAHSAGLLMTIINNSINGSFVPWAYDKLKYHDGEGIKKVSNSLLAIVVMVNTALIWLAPEAVRILAAPQYGEAIWCLVPIAISVYFYFAYTLFVDVEIYYGANHYIAIASISATVLNIVLNYVFIPIYGYIAAGYTTLFSYFVTMLLHLLLLMHLFSKRHKKFELFDIKAIALFGVLLVGMSTIAMLLYSHTTIRLLVILIACVIIALNYKKVRDLITILKRH